MKRLFITSIILFYSLTLLGQDGTFYGGWTKKSNSISGSWIITKSGETYKLTLDDQFKTKSAPDLKIFLSKKDVNSINSDNATKEATLVSPLQKASGKQQYIIKESIDISQYKTILIHCEEYSVLWGVAKLTQ